MTLTKLKQVLSPNKASTGFRHSLGVHIVLHPVHKSLRNGIKGLGIIFAKSGGSKAGFLINKQFFNLEGWGYSQGLFGF
ncbi:hypothetical protein [Microcoleus sp. OTE_8_concoct_300]|uniref:hypothetical protein n=1 Tax=Microcoleus sp. OTE_8_concoct_300 TaxID=2964710 RepID=UPI00403F9CF0